MTFVASALLLRALHTALTGARSAPGSARTWRDLVVGPGFVWRHPTIRPMTLMNTFHSASAGAVLGQFAPLAATLLGPDRAKSGTALEFLAYGVGGFAASLLLPWLSRRLSGPWIALGLEPLSAVFLFLCALTRTFPYLLCLLLCWGVCCTTVATNNIVFRQSRTPEPLLSRVNTSGRILTWGIGTTLGALAGGAVATAAGVGMAIATGAGFAAVAMAIGWLSPLRRTGPGRASSGLTSAAF